MRIIPPEKVQIIIELYPHTPTKDLAEKLALRVDTIHRKAARLGLRKTSECKAEIAKSTGAKFGQKTRFKSGHTPHNKGRKMSESTRQKCSPTMFKKGQMPASEKPIGYERINKDGTVEVKTERGFKSKARVIWVERFGAVPAGHIVTFADGDNRNFDLSNLSMISRADHARRNSLYSPEYKESLAIINQIGKIIKQYKNAKKYAEGPPKFTV